MSEENKYTAAIPLPPESGGQFSSGMELLSKVLKGAFLLMAGVIIAMLAWFLSFGGSFIVDSTTESVLVLKFGKLQKQYDQGWHWFLPYPVNKIVRIPIIKQELRTIAFMPYNTEKLKNPAAKQNEGPNANTLAPGIDGYALLGDNAIMHSEWKLTYRVSEPVKYFQNCMSREKTFASMDNASGPDQETVKLDNASMMLKNLLDDAVITVSAGLNIDQTFFANAEYESAVRKAVLERIAQVDIGVTLESLTVEFVAPPIRTADAFQQLLLSKEVAGKTVEDARAYRIEQLNLAQSEATAVIANAKAYKVRIVSEIEADAAYFSQILEKFELNPEATFVSLYSENMASALAAAREKYIVNTSGNGKRTLWLQMNREPAAPAGAQKTNEGKDR